MNTKTFLKYMAPFLVNGAWLLGAYLLFQSVDKTGLGGAWVAIGIIEGTIMGGALLNLVLCVVGFSRGNLVSGYTYLFILLVAILLWKSSAGASHGLPGKYGG